MNPQKLYNDLTFMYPDAKIWVIGHSLGGALASLIGATFGAPTIAFEAPGERMAAQRLHLPMPVSHNPFHPFCHWEVGVARWNWVPRFLLLCLQEAHASTRYSATLFVG